MWSYLGNLLFAGALVQSASAVPADAHGFRARDEPHDVTSCLAAKNVPYSVQSSSNWAELSTPYNLRLRYTPAVITLPTTADQVSDSVTCASAAFLKVQAKGGGHSYASHSSGGKDGSAIVDMENFNDITVDQTTWIAKVGAGVRLGNLALALYAQGQRALPHGTCPGVGVSGHALNGGYGYTSRRWGLTLDHIVALDVVLANGTQIHTDSDHFPNIFYAMRGAGASFGIVTHFYFQTEAAPSSVVYFSADLRSVLSNLETATSGFKGLQDFSLDPQHASADLTYGMYTDSRGSLGFSGLCHDCNVDEFRNTIFPAMLSSYPNAQSITVTQLSWIEALKLLANGQPLQQPLHGYDLHDTFYAKSLVTRQGKPMTDDSIRAFWSYIIDHQGQGPFFSIVNLYGGPNSAINSISPCASAYSDRDALWVFQNYGESINGVYDERTTVLINGLNAAVENAQQDGDFTAYLNYVDPSYSAEQAAEEYYGSETYDKLFAIKMDVDPQLVFWNPQSIGIAPVF